MTPIEQIKEAKRMLKHPFAFPGMYELACYLSDGERICRKCMVANWASIVHSTLHDSRDGWGLLGIDVYWEGPPEVCVDCNATLESEYGDPSADNE